MNHDSYHYRFEADFLYWNPKIFPLCPRPRHPLARQLAARAAASSPTLALSPLPPPNNFELLFITYGRDSVA